MNPPASRSIVPVSRPLRRFILATTIAPALFSTGAMAVDLVIPPDRTINSDNGTPIIYEGLLEGYINGTTDIDVTTPNPGQNGVQDRPRMGETNTKVIGSNNFWSDDQTWVYTGQVFDADGIFSFSENIDDRVRLTIDGTDVIADTAWDVPTKSDNFSFPDGNDYGMGPNGDGWHDFEVRFQNGGGGAGTVDNAGLGWGGGNNATYDNMGFGYAIDGVFAGDTNGAPSNVIPIEIQDGTPELFRVVGATGLNDDLIVTASGTLTIDGVLQNVQEQSLRFDNPAGATLTINDGTGAHKILSISSTTPANSTQWATATSGGSAVTIAGTSDFQPSLMTDNGIAVTVTQAGPGTLILNSTAAHTISNTTFAAAGGLISVSGTTDVVAGAAFTLTDAAGQISFGGGGTFSNNITTAASGTVVHSDTTTDTLSGAINTTAAPLNFNVSGGTLSVTGAITGAGIVKDGGAALSVSQPLTLPAVTVNAGTLTATNGSTVTAATVTGGTYAAQGATTFGTATVSGGTLNTQGATTITTAAVSGGTLDASAALTATDTTVTGGLIRTRAAATLTNVTVSGGRLEVQGDITITNQPTVSGAGTLALLSKAGSTISLSSPFAVNGGRVEVIPGSLGTDGGANPNPVALSAGTLSLGGGSLDLNAPVGLNAEIYNSIPALANMGNGDYNPDWGPDSLAQGDVDFGRFTALYESLAAGAAPRVITNTTANGPLLDFPNTRFSAF